MGYLKERHGIEVLPAKFEDSRCPICGVFHDERLPHDRDSLIYQYSFYDAHGRWPSWSDAMAHCMEEVQGLWKAELKNIGISVDEEPETIIATIKIDTSGKGD